MRSIIHARDEDSLRNGSFYHQRLGKKNSTYAHYINGDFISWAVTIPAGLKSWPLRDAKKIMPKSC